MRARLNGFHPNFLLCGKRHGIFRFVAGSPNSCADEWRFAFKRELAGPSATCATAAVINTILTGGTARKRASIPCHSPSQDPGKASPKRSDLQETRNRDRDGVFGRNWLSAWKNGRCSRRSLQILRNRPRRQRACMPGTMRRVPPSRGPSFRMCRFRQWMGNQNCSTSTPRARRHPPVGSLS